jgi:hypothetical protein
MSAGNSRAGWIRNAVRKREHIKREHIKREHIMNWLALLVLLSLGFLWHADPLDLTATESPRAADAATYASVPDDLQLHRL